MKISQIKQNAKNSLKDNLLVLFAGTAIAGILAQLTNTIYHQYQSISDARFVAQNRDVFEGLLNSSSNISFHDAIQLMNQIGLSQRIESKLIGGITVGIITFLLTAAFIYGTKVLVLNNIKIHKANFADIFAGFPKFGKAFAIKFFMAIYLFLWSLLLIIPAIVKSYSYAMTYYIALDNPDIAANEAITRSRQMMKGNKWRLFLLDLSFIGWWLLSVLTCGVLAVVYVVPYTETARATFYRNLIGETGETTQSPSDMSNVIEVSAEELNSKML